MRAVRAQRQRYEQSLREKAKKLSIMHAESKRRIETRLPDGLNGFGDSLSSEGIDWHDEDPRQESEYSITQTRRWDERFANRAEAILRRPPPTFTRTMSEPECLAKRARRRQERLGRHHYVVDLGPCFGAQLHRPRTPRPGRTCRPASAPHRRSSRSDFAKSRACPQFCSTEVQTDLTGECLDRHNEQRKSLACLVPQLKIQTPSGSRMLDMNLESDDENRSETWDWNYHSTWAAGAFEKLDGNSDGFVCRDELKSSAAREVMKDIVKELVGAKLSEQLDFDQVASFMLRHGDNDRNEGLSFDEFLFLTWRMKCMESNPHLEGDFIFTLFDSDGNGKIGREEFRHVFDFLSRGGAGKSSNEFIDEQFNGLDRDQSGEICKAEYRLWLKESGFVAPSISVSARSRRNSLCSQ